MKNKPLQTPNVLECETLNFKLKKYTLKTKIKHKNNIQLM